MPESRGGKRGGKRRRGSTSAESGQTQKGSAEKITRSDNEDLIKWTSFEEVEGIVQSRVTEVIVKAINRGYTSAKEVYEDYRIFHALRTKLINGQDELRVAIFSSEYFYRHALMEKALMLSTISSDALQGDQQKWISQQLKLEEYTPEELFECARAIEGVDARVSEMEKNVQNQIAEQNKNKLEDLAEIRSRFQAGNFDVKVEVFEELKQKISSEEKLMDSLDQRYSTCYDTLRYGLGDVSTVSLKLEFKRLLRDDEKDLLSSWSNLTLDVMKLAQDEKEQLQEAMLRSLMARPSY